MVPVAAEVHEVVVGSQQLMFSTQSGMPVRWVSCYPDCESAGAVKVVWFDQSDGFLAWTLSAEPQLAAKLRGSEFAMEQNDTAEFLQLIFRSKQLFNGNYVEFEYRLPKQGYRGELHARGIEGLALTLATGASMIPEQLPGFGSIYSKVRPFSMDQADFSYLEPPDSGFGAFDMHVASSIGTRSRYWLWLAEPRSQSVGEYGWADINRPIVLVRSSTGSAELILDTYTGPSEFRALQAADPRLTSVLFAAIWNWLRYLSFGLLFLLEWLHGFLGNYGLAIILLSLTVKILMFPLTYVADKWQAQVNATASLLKPKLDEIKRNYKGEEAHNKILAVYKDHNVSQFYTLRSLFGFLIQIPVFIAAFDMLAESFVLGQASFLWISDLAKPDSFAALPFVLPFFGGQLNLLPVVMTALTILSALVQEEADLTPDLMRQQRIKLLLMALAFFLLFYTFPAGMVLYWTANNLFHLLKILPARLRRS
jgi:YidC/Oxa1 family membrane protein insertase